jgi:hypothetical protein
MPVRRLPTLVLTASLFAALFAVAGPVTVPSASAQSLTTVTPARLLDTRPTGTTIDGQQQAGGALDAATTITLPIAGRASVPAAGATAVAITITAIAPTANSVVTAFPSGTTRPNVPNLQVVAGRTWGSMAIVPLGTGGAIDLHNEAGTTQLAVDVIGWFGITGDYTALTPGRLLDTRPTGTTVDGQQQAGGAIGPNATRTVPIAGRGGVPLAGVGAVAVNITAVGPTVVSTITAFPSGTTRPNVPNLQVVAGDIVNNMVIVPLGANGAIDLHNEAGTTQVLVDVVGWFAAGGDYTALVPGRLLDTRPTGATVDGQQQAGGTFGAATIRTLPVAGRGGVPLFGAAAVVLQFTAVGPSTAGFVTAFPTASTRPTVSTLSVVAGRTLTTLAVVPLGAGGAIDVYNDAGTTHLLVEVVGWLPPTPTPSTSIVNRRLDNNLHGGNGEEVGISRDGRFVVFATLADNMVSGDLNAHQDVFVKDLATGKMELVSVTSTEEQLTSDSFDPVISDDGRYVLFRTAAPVAAGDGNGLVDVYRRDRKADTTELVSLDSTGSQFTFAIDDADMSGDGNVVAFSTVTSVTTVTTRSVFVRKIAAGTTVTANLPVNSYSSSSGLAVAINQDGTKVALSKRFNAGGTNFFHIFRYDVTGNRIQQMTQYVGTATNEQGGAVSDISDDGTAVLYRRNGTIAVTPSIGAVEQIVATGTPVTTRERFAGSSSDVLFATSVGLAAGDTNGQHDVYLRTTAATPVFSVLSRPTTPNTQSNGFSALPAMSADRSVLAFSTAATNIVSGLMGDVTNVVALRNGVYTVASTANDGVTAHGAAAEPVLSADGRYVAFASQGSDLTTTDFDGLPDVFRYDRQTDTTTHISLSTDAAALHPDISDDGNRVVFITSGPVPGSPGVFSAFPEIFVRDVAAGTTTAVTPPTANQSALGAQLSGNGRFVVFQSFASNLLANDTNGAPDVFVRDLQTGSIERANLTFTGGQSVGGTNDAVMAPDISVDGRYVTWTSSATNLVPGATTPAFRVYRRDRLTSQTVLVAEGQNPKISDDGSRITFESVATDLVAGDTNGQRDVFVKNLATGALTRVSVATGGAQATGGGSARAEISGNGRWVVFLSNATTLVAGDTNARADMFRHDTLTGVTVRVSVRGNDIESVGGDVFDTPSISESGRFVAFASGAIGLALGDANANQFHVDLFLRDLG